MSDLAAAEALHEEIGRGFITCSLFQWGTAERGTNTMVGTCTLAAPLAEHQRTEVGFALARTT